MRQILFAVLALGLAGCAQMDKRVCDSLPLQMLALEIAAADAEGEQVKKDFDKARAALKIEEAMCLSAQPMAPAS